MLSPGDRVKDYEVIAPLRSGGMAMLYLARRRGVGGFSRLVALKLVHSHLLDHEGINRLFLEEARIAANIAHPNVVNVEEVGQCGGNYFIAMEYVHGVSLGELLGSLVDRRLRMSPKLCVWLAAQVAEALHAAHEATGENGVPLRIVHRDVSPQNILISHTGHIKLIDFGIAGSQHTSEHDGNGRSVLGKLGYMAPEQLRMQVADRRSDVYALGVTLWEMLTSRNLFRCQRIDDERDWATREAPPPPSKYSAIAMPALDRAVLKAIACEPDARHESALAFRAALLRAAPAAAQVDAPIFAALMHSMLGAELERRSANWPSDVSRELHLDEIENTPALNLGELTADMGGADDSRTARDAAEEDPTTVAEAPSALRSARPAGPTAADGEERDSARARAMVYASATPSTPQAQIDTVAVPPSDARPPAGRTLRALSLAALSLVLGLMLGSLSSGSPPGTALGVALETQARAAPATPPARKPTFTVLSELRLGPAATVEARGSAREQSNLEVRGSAQSKLEARASSVAAEAPGLLPTPRALVASAADAPEPPLVPSQAVASTAEAPARAPVARLTPAPERRAPAHARAAVKRGPAGARKAMLRPARAKPGGLANRKQKSVPRPRAAMKADAPW
jgi:serine/threonine protein kinase